MNSKGRASGQPSPKDRYVPSVAAVSLYHYTAYLVALWKAEFGEKSLMPDYAMPLVPPEPSAGPAFSPRISVKCEYQQIPALAVINCRVEKKSEAS